MINDIKALSLNTAIKINSNIIPEITMIKGIILIVDQWLAKILIK